MNGLRMKGARIAATKRQNETSGNESTATMMNNSANNAIVAIYKSHAEAGTAVNRTNAEAFDEHQPSRATAEQCLVAS